MLSAMRAFWLPGPLHGPGSLMRVKTAGRMSAYFHKWADPFFTGRNSHPHGARLSAVRAYLNLSHRQTSIMKVLVLSTSKSGAPHGVTRRLRCTPYTTGSNSWLPDQGSNLTHTD